MDPPKLGVGAGLISSLLKKAYLLTRSQLSDIYRKHGDAGSTARECFAGSAGGGKRQGKVSDFFTGGGCGTNEPLTLGDVWRCLKTVEALNATGAGSVAKKTNVLLDTLQRCETGDCACYFVRCLVDNMRVGCNVLTLLDGVAAARWRLDGGEGDVKDVKRMVREKWALGKDDIGR